MDKKVRVLLVDDDNDFAYKVINEVTRDLRLLYLGHATCMATAIEKSCDLNPDIVIMDLHLAGNWKDGIEAAKEIRLTTDAKILFLTVLIDTSIMFEANKKAFASGYVFKNQMKHITDTIYDAATIDTPHKLEIQESVRKKLTPTEMLILQSLVEGNSEVLKYSAAKTITNHKTRIYRKLGLKSEKELRHVFGNW